jgi:hypothetical protein
MTNIYHEISDKASALFDRHGLLGETVQVKARALSTEEAIGNPEADDFPLQQGKERLMQADIGGALGQAFTDRFGDFEGTLGAILDTPLTNNFRRAIFVASINAALRYLGLIGGTVHCRDQGPGQCARALADHIQDRYGNVKITIIGFQPRMVEALAAGFAVRVLDMDEDNINKDKFGVTVEHPMAAQSAVDWADLLLVTGTTLVNGTLPDFLGDKPAIFYGTTIAGAAYLMGWTRFCDSSN